MLKGLPIFTPPPPRSVYPQRIEETSYLIVDGGCLDVVRTAIAERYYGLDDVPIDYAKLRGDHRKVFYYDALPVQKTGEADDDYRNRRAPKDQQLDFIYRAEGFHVRTGEARHRKGRGSEQKMVDVQLAVDTMALASRGTLTKCSILTSDVDFKPLIDALVDLGVDVTLLYNPKGVNEDLVKAADRARPCNVKWIEKRLFSAFVEQNPLPSRNAALEGMGGTFELHSWNDENGRNYKLITDYHRYFLLAWHPSTSPSPEISYVCADRRRLLNFAADVDGAVIDEHAYNA